MLRSWALTVPEEHYLLGMIIQLLFVRGGQKAFTVLTSETKLTAELGGIPVLSLQGSYIWDYSIHAFIFHLLPSLYITCV